MISSEFPTFREPLRGPVQRPAKSLDYIEPEVLSDQGYTADPDHDTWDPEDTSDRKVAGPDHDGRGGLNLQPKPDASPMVAPRIGHDQSTPLYDRGIGDMDTVGPVEKAGEDTGRRKRANEFMASLAPALRGMILTGPIATLDAGGREQWAPLLEQLDQMDGNRGEDTDAEEAVAKELARVFIDEGGDPARLHRMLDTAGRADRSQRWLDELRAEVLKEPVIPVLKEHLQTEVTEAALEVLAFVLAFPTGPVGWLWLATKLLAAADT